MSEMSVKVTDFFRQQFSETTFLNEEDGDFQINSNEEKTYPYTIDQTCVTYSCIRGESSSNVSLDSQTFHSTSSFQFPKDEV